MLQELLGSCYHLAVGHITLIEPNGRRLDLTPRGRLERVRRALSTALAISASLLLWALLIWVLLRPAFAQSNTAIANAIIRECAAIYHATGHPCACPEDRMRNGRACGRRSAYSKPGGASPLCYIKDVTAQEIADYRAGKKSFLAQCRPGR